jgi:hypothetical protein
MSNKTKNLEYYEKRFGDIAIEKGFITHGELTKALTIQCQEEIESGTYLLIREIFLDQSTMHVNQIEEVVKAIFN